MSRGWGTSYSSTWRIVNTSSFEKPEWREENLQFLLGRGGGRRPSPLVRNGKITCAYAEMCGESGFAFFEMMRPFLTSPKHFLGIDNDPVVSFKNVTRLLDVPVEERFEFAHGDFYRVCHRALDRGFPLAAINVDDTAHAGETWWRDSGRALVEVVRRVLKAQPTISLILNCSLDEPKQTVAERSLREHAMEMSRYFAEWDLSPRALGVGEIGKVGSTQFVGWAGAFQVYRSAGRPLRMVTVRMKINGGKTNIDHACRR